jgi:hypothetical protein
MAELTTVAVRTVNSLYEITILDGSVGDVLVRGGKLFPERTPLNLSGSSFGGSFLKWRWICPGMRLEFVPQPVEIVTRTVYDEITGSREFLVGHTVFWTSVVHMAPWQIIDGTRKFSGKYLSAGALCTHPASGWRAMRQQGRAGGGV